MFSATVAPQLVVKNKQQTPNPSAQEPSPQQVSRDNENLVLLYYIVTISTLHVTIRIREALSEPGGVAAWKVKLWEHFK